MADGPEPMPAAEIAVDSGAIRLLVDRSFAEYRHLPIEIVANGWDNVVARLGREMAVRIPRRATAVPLLEHELRWIPEVAPRIPLEVPDPIHRGEPDGEFPWTWSIVRWVHGLPADATGPPSAADVEAMAAFLRTLAVAAPDGAPANPFRGVQLAHRHDRVIAALDRLRRGDRERIEALWHTGLDAEVYSGPPVWIHGDLHPANLVVRDGALVGVIDWGDIAAGDPAADLQVAWTWFGPDGAAALLRALDVDDATAARARANALAHGLACLAFSADNPRMAAVGTATLGRVLEGP